MYFYRFILTVRLDFGQILGGLNNNQGSKNNNMNQHLQEKISIIGQLLGNNNGGGGNPNDPLGSIIGGILDNVQVDVTQNDQGQFQIGVNPKPGGQFASTTTTRTTTTTTRTTTTIRPTARPTFGSTTTSRPSRPNGKVLTDFLLEN